MDNMKGWLSPTFFKKGTDIAELEELIAFLDSHTQTENASIGDICQMALDRTAPSYTAENLTFKVWTPGDDDPGYGALAYVPDVIPRQYFDEIRNLQLMYRYDGHGVLAAEAFTSSMFRLLDLPYSGMLKRPSPKRAEYVHEVMNMKPETRCTIVSRYDEECGIVKVFFCGSGQFRAIPQQAALDILQSFPAKLGRVDLKYWEADHSFTRLWVTFPEYTEDIFDAYQETLPETEEPLVPGLMIETGDIGDCSFKITETWSAGKTVLYGAEVVKDHRKGKDEETTADILDKLAGDVTINIFDKFTTLPMQFAKLLQTEIVFAAGIHFEELFKDLGIAKILGKTVDFEGEPAPIKMEEVEERLIGALTGLNPLTGYKVMIELLRLPEMLKDRTKREDCRKAFAKLPYKLYRYI